MHNFKSCMHQHGDGGFATCFDFDSCMRQLDDVAVKLLQKSLAERGMKFLIGAQTQELMGGDDGRVRAVKFKDGTEVPADLVCMAVGIRPNTLLAEKMRLHVNRGIVVNDTLQTTTDARIYAVGECAAHRRTVSRCRP